MTPDAIVFDFDGVLVESLAIKGEAFAALYEDQPESIQLEITAYHNAHGGVTRYDKIRHFHKTYLGKNLSKAQIQDWADRFSKIVETKVIGAAEVKGAKDFLQSHADTYPMFVASATPQAELKRIVDSRGLSRFFKGVFGAPVSKGRHIRHVLDEYGFDANRVIMVGDAMSDYEAAMETGVKFIARMHEDNQALFPENTVKIADCTNLAEAIRMMDES